MKAERRKTLMDAATRWVFFQWGFNILDPAEWTMMSGIAGTPDFQQAVREEFERLAAREY